MQMWQIHFPLRMLRYWVFGAQCQNLSQNFLCHTPSLFGCSFWWFTYFSALHLLWICVSKGSWAAPCWWILRALFAAGSLQTEQLMQTRGWESRPQGVEEAHGHTIHGSVSEERCWFPAVLLSCRTTRFIPWFFFCYFLSLTALWLSSSAPHHLLPPLLSCWAFPCHPFPIPSFTGAEQFLTLPAGAVPIPVPYWGENGCLCDQCMAVLEILSLKIRTVIILALIFASGPLDAGRPYTPLLRLICQRQGRLQSCTAQVKCLSFKATVWKGILYTLHMAAHSCKPACRSQTFPS